jgi:hypothetical protein
MEIKCCISVLHWNSVSISSNRPVIEVHDYAWLSKEISCLANNYIICAWWLRKFMYIKWPRRTDLLLEIEFSEWKRHKHFQILVVFHQLKSRHLYYCHQFWWMGMRYMPQETCCSCCHQYQLVLWVDVPHCWQWGSVQTEWLFVGWDDFASLVLLVLKSLEEIRKYWYSNLHH